MIYVIKGLNAQRPVTQQQRQPRQRPPLSISQAYARSTRMERPVQSRAAQA